MGAIEIPQKNSIGARIQIIMLKGILLLKRAWRLGKRLIKEMGFSFVITALLMVLFVLILVWARVKTEENPNIILIVLDYAPMIYTSIFTLIAVTVFFVSNKIDLKIKIPVFVAIILLLISTWIKGLYMIWHAFSMPNGYS